MSSRVLFTTNLNFQCFLKFLNTASDQVLAGQQVQTKLNFGGSEAVFVLYRRRLLNFCSQEAWSLLKTIFI